MVIDAQEGLVAVWWFDLSMQEDHWKIQTSVSISYGDYDEDLEDPPVSEAADLGCHAERRMRRPHGFSLLEQAFLSARGGLSPRALDAVDESLHRRVVHKRRHDERLQREDRPPGRGSPVALRE